MAIGGRQKANCLWDCQSSWRVSESQQKTSAESSLNTKYRSILQFRSLREETVECVGYVREGIAST